MIPIDVEIFVALEPIDLRISFDLLSGVVRDKLGGDPKSGSLYVFFGKRKDKLKALFYDKTGYCILYKRLCRGTFRIPEALRDGELRVQLEEEELAALLHGLGGKKAPAVERKRNKKSIIH